MLDFEPGLFIWTIVSFGLLVLLLYKAALPPILNLLALREKTIADSLAEAEKNRQLAEELLKEYRGKLAGVHKTADQVLEQARSEGEKLRQEVLARANQQAELVAERSRQDFAREKDKILQEVRLSTAELVTSAASKLLRRIITPEDNRVIIEASLKEAKS